jgi:hypothetical protein
MNKNIENLVESILVDFKKLLLERLQNSDDFLEEEVNTEDLLDESNPNFATPDDFEDMTPINLNNVLSK